jgi:hypothetical protein
MTDATPGADDASQPTVEQSALAPNVPPAFASNGGAPPPAAPERPELTVAAAFAGGLALALVLKRLAR